MGQVNRTPLAAALAVSLGLMTGCTGSSPSPAGSPRTAVDALPSGPSPGIELPVGANRSLPQAPGAGTIDGAVYAAAVVHATKGVIVSGTVSTIRSAPGEFDVDYPVTTLNVERTFAGDPPPAVTIRTADPTFAMEEGHTYLIFLSQDAPESDYAPVDTYLFDKTAAGWTARTPDVGPGGRQVATPLTLTDEQVADVVVDGQTYLDHRQAAGRAKMTIGPGESEDEVVVSGYTPGEAIELTICAADDGFNPKTDASRRCGTDLREALTAEEPSFTAKVTMPKQLILGDGSTIDCDAGGCALVAYDAGWPDRVFAVYRR